MIMFCFKLDGREERLVVHNPDSNQRLEEYYHTASRSYLLDELILILDKNYKQLSINNPSYELKQIAELNSLSEVSVTLDGKTTKPVV